MFEDALVESGGRFKTRSNWWTLASLAFYAGVLGTMILVPLLDPEMLPRQILKDLLVTPPAPVAPAALPAAAAQNHGSSKGGLVQNPMPLIVAKNSIPLIHTIHDGPVDTAPGGGGGIPGADFGPAGIGIPFGGPTGMDSRPPAPRIATRHEPVKVSNGVMAGYAIYRPDPVYPQIARAAHVQGIVVLEVTISRTGTIEGMHVVSGNPMLVTGAMDTVKSWRYRPYVLNGEPVEVQMQVSVLFTLGG
jgi:protein TonB